MKYERDLYLMQQIFAAIFTLANKLQIKCDKTLEFMTTRQMMAMLAILHLPEGKATHSSIARILGTTRQSEKQLIDLMEQKGYVTAVSSKVDKRAADIQITDAGKKVILSCAERSLGFLSDAFDNFTTAELENLWTLLSKLYHYDCDEPIGFEENVSYGEEDGLTPSQLLAIEKFEHSREK